MSNATPASAYPAPSYVQSIAPYQAGKPIEELAREWNLDPKKIVKLASNENPLGISPLAQAAIAQHISGLGRYPDANGYYLKSAISRLYDIPSNHLVLGNGSNDILELAAHAFLEPGSAAVFSQYAFIVYSLATKAVGAQAIVVPAQDYGHDLDAMFAAITSATRIVFIANPNNPTGTCLSTDALEQFLEKVYQKYHTQLIVVLDEAYNEYQSQKPNHVSAQWCQRFTNLLVVRTFSKAYGLAGLRVGFGMGHPSLIDLMNRVRQPFNVNLLAQVAAIAALADQSFLQQTYENNRQGYEQITQALNQLGITYVPSHANFVLMHVPAPLTAQQLNQDLLMAGVIVRPVTEYGLPNALRVSIGLEQENAVFIQALTDILQAHGVQQGAR